MNYYSQYGEEVFLESFFKNKKDGFCVEVGAADGIRYSNSRYLIESGWRAILIEPHPDFFIKLSELYPKNQDKVILMNIAISNYEGFAELFLFGRDEHAQVSTISKDQKERVIHYHGNKFEEIPHKVKVNTLESVFEKYKTQVDFLSVDAEGVDMDVLKSNNWSKHRPSLICVEHSMDHNILNEYMNSVEYSLVYKNIGNSFFISKKSSDLK